MINGLKKYLVQKITLDKELQQEITIDKKGVEQKRITNPRD